MYEIRLHGLGGEGVVKLSEMIGKAATRCGQWAHSFPFFGTEIRGAAVKAFTRVDTSRINVKSYIYEPDIVIVTNEILLENHETTEGLKDEGCLLVNTAKISDQFLQKAKYRIIPLNATQMAYDTIGKPIVNTIMFGAFIGISGLIPMNIAAEIISEEFPEKIAKLNIPALQKGFEEIKKEI